jgi:hypothetical protein
MLQQLADLEFEHSIVAEFCYAVGDAIYRPETGDLKQDSGTVEIT